MSAKTKLVVAVVLLAAVGTTAWKLTDGEARPAKVAAETGAPALDREPPTGPTTAHAERNDTPRVTDSRPASSSQELAENQVTLHGRVLTLRGAPVSDAPIVTSQDPGKVLIRSDGEGSFQFVHQHRGPFSTLELMLGSSRHLSIAHAVIRPGDEHKGQVLVVVESVHLAGQVVNQEGEPVPAALLYVPIPVEIYKDFPQALDRTRRPRWTFSCDPQGRFSIDVPRIEGARLQTTAGGYRRDSRPVPAQPDENLRIELESLSEELPESAITGVVLLPDYAPAQGATVRFAMQEVVADEFGRFVLPYGSWLLPDRPLVAALHNHQAALIENYGQHLLERGDRPPEPVTLVLGEKPLTLAGRVVDAEGEALSDWLVTLHDGTVASQGMLPPVLLESMSGGNSRVACGQGGRFELTGLQDRAYRLMVYHPHGDGLFVTEAIPAGTREALLVAPRDLYRERVRGRVLSARGQAVANALVESRIITFEEHGGSTFFGSKSTRTDEQGYFQLAQVPRYRLGFQVSGEHLIPAEFDLEPLASSEDLEFVVQLRCHIRVLAEGSAARTYRVWILDEQGEKLTLYLFQAGGMSTRGWIQIEDGRSAIHALSAAAATLVVADASGNELGTQPIRLQPGEVTEVSLDSAFLR